MEGFSSDDEVQLYANVDDYETSIFGPSITLSQSVGDEEEPKVDIRSSKKTSQGDAVAKPKSRQGPRRNRWLLTVNNYQRDVAFWDG